ncbi:uncharacterized protein LAJ45_01023 [Morchella importuna]|uniref:uncharacterized protein n=1 Tax=Morchella importuna TaxID=1174673 RepID=UPI001E8DE706|nr:uncharacterized protein LAJ45_01023 [Morchella importuna]KAH8154495.1 hypothetical protein LAJ45_01023 [Morchella importuna]
MDHHVRSLLDHTTSIKILFRRGILVYFIIHPHTIRQRVLADSGTLETFSRGIGDILRSILHNKILIPGDRSR